MKAAMKAALEPAESSLENQLDEVLLEQSAKTRYCPDYVRTWLDVLQQQPFLAVYTVHSSPEAAAIREGLLELSSGKQTQILVKVLQVLKIVLREPGNRKIVRKGDIATMLEHLRLQTSPAVTTECTKVLLNCCTEPTNAMRLVDLDGLSNFLSMLSCGVGDEARASVAGIIQSICLQAKGREAVRASKIVPALTSLLRAGSAPVQAAAAAALANLSCDPQSVRLIRRTSGIRPLVDLIGSSEGDTARSAAAAVQNLSCEAASRVCIRESAAVKKLVSLLGAEDMEASICASGALLNILLPMVNRSGGAAAKLQGAIRDLVSCAMVLSTARLGLQTLNRPSGMGKPA